MLMIKINGTKSKLQTNVALSKYLAAYGCVSTQEAQLSMIKILTQY